MTCLLEIDSSNTEYFKFDNFYVKKYLCAFLCRMWSKVIWHLWTIRWCHCSKVFPTFKLHLSIKRPICKFYTIIRVFYNTKSQRMYCEKSEICHENKGHNLQSEFQLGAADVSRSTRNYSGFFFFSIFFIIILDICAFNHNSWPVYV